jgi:hypothetical protein
LSGGCLAGNENELLPGAEEEIGPAHPIAGGKKASASVTNNPHRTMQLHNSTAYSLKPALFVPETSFAYEGPGYVPFSLNWPESGKFCGEFYLR